MEYKIMERKIGEIFEFVGVLYLIINTLPTAFM